MLRRVLILLALLALAGCGGGTADNCYMILLSDGSLAHAHGHHARLENGMLYVFPTVQEQSGGAVFRGVVSFKRHEECQNAHRKR